MERAGESRIFGRRGIPRGRLARKVVVEVVVRSLAVIAGLVSQVEQRRCPDSHYTDGRWDLAGVEHIQVAR